MTTSVKGLHALFARLPGDSGAPISAVFSQAFGIDQNKESFFTALKVCRTILSENLALLGDLELDATVEQAYRESLTSLLRFFGPTNFDAAYGPHYRSFADKINVQTLLFLHGHLEKTHGISAPSSEDTDSIARDLEDCRRSIEASNASLPIKGFLCSVISELEDAKFLFDIIGPFAFRDVWSQAIGKILQRFVFSSESAETLLNAREAIFGIAKVLAKIAVVLHLGAQAGQSADWYIAKFEQASGYLLTTRSEASDRKPSEVQDLEQKSDIPSIDVGSGASVAIDDIDPEKVGHGDVGSQDGSK